MTFEEFFTKKRIDLVALQSGEPGLFSEFKKHFEQMGEKSFDHTKKYWFNKLRLQYHLAPELKPEKVRMENQLAEQTIIEALVEEKIPAPSVGFKPRFKPGMASKPAESISDIKDPAPENNATITPEVNEAAAESPATKPAGFKPRFNMKMAAPKTEQAEAPEAKPEETQDAPEPMQPVENAAPKPAGFKPRFNMKMAAPKTEQAEAPEAKPEATENAAEPKQQAENAATKPAGFKPRFNMEMVAPKPAEGEEPKAEIEQPAAPAAPEDNPQPKPAYKPKFNMKNIKPKPPEE